MKNVKKRSGRVKPAAKLLQLSLPALRLLNRLQGPVDYSGLVMLLSKEYQQSVDEIDGFLKILVQNGVLQLLDDQSAIQTTYYGSGYNYLLNQRSMLQDRARTLAFKRAIEFFAKPSSTVIDVGAGSGILSMFAASAGYKAVHSIECTNVIEDAKLIAMRNNLFEKIQFHSCPAQQFKLNKKVDVIVSEWVGYFLMEEYMYVAFQNIRDRFLKPNGKVIPYAADLFLAPIEDAELYHNTGFGFWESPVYGYDFSFAKHIELTKLMTYNTTVRPHSLISDPYQLLHLDCYEDNIEALNFKKNGQFTINRSANLHGFVGYFDLHLAPGVVLSTSPDAVTTHWCQVYFPIEQLFVEQGDRLRINLIVSRGSIKPIIELKLTVLRRNRAINRASYCYNSD